MRNKQIVEKCKVLGGTGENSWLDIHLKKKENRLEMRLSGKSVNF